MISLSSRSSCCRLAVVSPNSPDAARQVPASEGPAAQSEGCGASTGRERRARGRICRRPRRPGSDSLGRTNFGWLRLVGHGRSRMTPRRGRFHSESAVRRREFISRSRRSSFRPCELGAAVTSPRAVHLQLASRRSSFTLPVEEHEVGPGTVSQVSAGSAARAPIGGFGGRERLDVPGCVCISRDCR